MLLEDTATALDNASLSRATGLTQNSAPTIELVRVVNVSGERAWVCPFFSEQSPHVLALASFALDTSCVGQMAAAVRFGDQMILLGWVRGLADALAAHTPTTAPSAHQTIEASTSLTLRCGEASLSLNSDGSLVLRGKSVSSYARGTQRIRGAVVEIN